MLPVVIVGGGISGLSAAYFLERSAAEAGLEVSIHLMEGRNRLGGVILTERSQDCLLEGGPDSFLAQKSAGIELCKALGLSEQLIPSNDHQRKTYILHQGQMKEIPEGLMFLAPTKLWPVLRSNLFSLSGKLRLAGSPFFSPHLRPEEDVSVADFISQRLGQEALERLAEPLLAAVYGANVDSLSTRTVLPQFVALEEKYGTLWRGIQHTRRCAPPREGNQPAPGGLFLTLRNGLGELIAVLEKSLAKTQVRTQREIVTIRRPQQISCFRVEWEGGAMDAAAVILATPAHAAARMVQELDLRLAQTLDQIRYHSSVIVSLAFAEGQLHRPFDGFGFIVPRGEGKKLIACTSVSTKFPFRCPPGRLLLRCFLGGSRDPSILDEDDQRVLQTTLDELRNIAGLRAEPTFARIYRWENCMPQYSVGHPRRWQEISSLLERHPGLYLSGNGYHGVGLPDCIQTSAKAATATLQHLHSLR